MGFVGLVSATSFAKKCFDVIATTLEEDAVKMVNSGRAPFYEEGLDDLLSEAVESGMRKASLDN